MTPSFDRDALLDYGIALARAVAERDGYLGPLADLLKGDRLAWRMSLDMDAKIDICFALSAYAAATLLGVDVNAVERRPLIPIVEREPEREPLPVTHVPGQNIDWREAERRNRPPRTRLQNIAGHLGRSLTAEEITHIESTDKR
jgi:hypothetical protein